MKFGSNALKVSSSKDIPKRLRNVDSSKSVDLRMIVRNEFEKMLTHEAFQRALIVSTERECPCCQAAHEKSLKLEQEHKKLLEISKRQQIYLSHNVDLLCKKVHNYFERLTTLEDIVRDMYRTGIRDEVTDILKRMQQNATYKDKQNATFEATNVDILTGTQQLIKTSAEQREREEELLRQLEFANIDHVPLPINETTKENCCNNCNEKLVKYKDFIRKYELENQPITQEAQTNDIKSNNDITITSTELQKPKSLTSNGRSKLKRKQSTKKCCSNRSEILRKSRYVTPLMPAMTEPLSQTDSVDSGSSKTLKIKKSTHSKKNQVQEDYQVAVRRQFLSNLLTLRKSEYTMHLNSLKRTIENPLEPHLSAEHRNKVDTRNPDFWPQGVVGSFIGKPFGSLSKRT